MAALRNTAARTAPGSLNRRHPNRAQVWAVPGAGRPVITSRCRTHSSRVVHQPQSTVVTAKPPMQGVPPPPAGATATPLGQTVAPPVGGGRGLWQGYMHLLQTRPLATKAVTSGIIAFAGDITCQQIVGHLQPAHPPSQLSDDKALGSTRSKGPLVDMDWGRSVRFAMLGTVLVAPALHVWYGLLARWFPGTTVSQVAKRIAMDQFVFTPPFLATFFTCLLAVEGKVAKVPAKLEADYFPTLVSNWGLWMPAQFINFTFVPPALQVLYANAVGYFWNTYLSYQSFKAEDPAKPDVPDSDAVVGAGLKKH